ncbi:MAG: hypothetical protein Q8O67_20910, partial [Deltaproteobacteria bacterium]|nr:hypothetical protein [Deltaproteobacteria bacterium]
DTTLNVSRLGVSTIRMSALTSLLQVFITDNDNLTTIEMPLLESIGGPADISGNPGLTSCTGAGLAAVGDCP